MKSDEEGLEYSEAALSNRALFLSPFNDLNIFVEDSYKEYVYEEIFERLFGNEITIFSIFPLGGKESVLKEYEKRGANDEAGKANIYIVDGDFDILWDDQRVVSPNVIYLERYNIEGYYCTKEAVIKFARGFLHRTRSAIEEMVCFDQWKNTVCREIGSLFTLFAVVNRYCPGLPNVNQTNGRFVDANGYLIKDEALKYREEVNEKIDNVDELIISIKEKIDTQFVSEGENAVFSIICGKCQIESLCRYIKSKCGRNINREQLRNYLVSNFELEPLLFLKDRILTLLADALLPTQS